MCVTILVVVEGQLVLEVTSEQQKRFNMSQ